MKRAFALGLMLMTLSTFAQDKPKLIVGIVVDQMRTDYIYRYWDKFGEDGFKRLVQHGYFCKNTHFNYVPTYTGPGHASIYTGATPMNHGIISNNWFEKETGEFVYCAQDDARTGVGTDTDAGKMSPVRMLAPTLGDAVRISNQFKGKSIGLSIKDRGAILPAGHSANAAYWLDYETGNFITSDYYMDKLPKWITSFNAKKWPDQLSKDGWQTLLAMEHYTESTADDTPYEKVYNPNGKPVFPYDLTAMIKEKGYYPFAISPYGNTLLRMLADQAIIHEDLGDDDHTDLLAISFSTPDMAGHAFGPQSVEVEDIYLRLDVELAQLLESLDERVGVGEYVLFLTADHAGAQVPAYMKDQGIPMWYFDGDAFDAGLKKHLTEQFGEGDWIRSISNQQVFLNHALISSEGKDVRKFMEAVEQFAISFEGVASTLNVKDMRHPLPPDQFARMAQMGWHPKRSGDVLIQLLPGWMEYGHQGTTHGSSYSYDSHVPLIFYGRGIAQGTHTGVVDITQIAPTISVVSSIAFPAVSDHRVISGALK